MHPPQRLADVLQHPGRFMLQVLRGFRANQGLLLAGAVAYCALLSIVPLLMLTVIALSHFVDQVELLQTVSRYLEWLVPGQSQIIVAEFAGFLAPARQKRCVQLSVWARRYGFGRAIRHAKDGSQRGAAPNDAAP